MANTSKIQWTDATWNIARGCSKVDEDVDKSKIKFEKPKKIVMKFKDKIADSRKCSIALIIILLFVIIAISTSFILSGNPKYTVTIHDGCNQKVFYNCYSATQSAQGTRLFFPDGSEHWYSPSVQIRIVKHY